MVANFLFMWPGLEPQYFAGSWWCFLASVTEVHNYSQLQQLCIKTKVQDVNWYKIHTDPSKWKHSSTLNVYVKLFEYDILKDTSLLMLYSNITYKRTTHETFIPAIPERTVGAELEDPGEGFTRAMSTLGVFFKMTKNDTVGWFRNPKEPPAMYETQGIQGWNTNYPVV